MNTEKAIVLHAVVPVRAEAREQAEQTTQLLFGEVVEIKDTLPRSHQKDKSEFDPPKMTIKGKWTKIKNESDGQEGWVDSKMVSPLTEEEWQAVRAADKTAMVKVPVAYAVSMNNGQTIPLSIGTRLYDYKEGIFKVLGVSFRIDPAMVAEQPIELTEQNLQIVCRFLLNVPYLWGGKNGLGMDCSGFVQQVLSVFGIRLPRNASEQAMCGEEIAFEEAQAGDLVFMCHPDEERVTHVGILIGKETLIHCSGRVKVEKISKEGTDSHKLLITRCISACRVPRT